MDEYSGRKTPLEIVEEKDEEINPGRDQRLVKPPHSEPTTFTELIDWDKLKYGQNLIACCILLLFVASLIGYFTDRNNAFLSNLVEVLKLICTTALGYVFAKTPDWGGKRRD